MTIVIAHLHVDAAGRVTGRVASTVPPGDYTTQLEVAQDTAGPGAGASDQLTGRFTTAGRGPLG